MRHWRDLVYGYIRHRAGFLRILRGRLDVVFSPVLGDAELGAECVEPGIVEFGLAALDELPCAGRVGTLLDREVDVADRDVVLEFVVKDCLEGAYDLEGWMLA